MSTMSIAPTSHAGGPPILDANWSEIWDRVAAALPNTPAVISPSGSLSYSDLEERSARVAGLLQSRGLGRGSKVAIYLYNRAEYLETIYAAFKIGAIPVNVNFRYRADELTSLLDSAEAEALVFPASLVGHVVEASTQLPHLTLIAVDDAADQMDAVRSTLPDAVPFADAASNDRANPVPVSGDDEVFMFTGGTTGKPKAVVWRHRDLFDSQLVSIYGAIGITPPSTLDGVVELAVNPDVPAPRTLPITPLMHAMAMFNTMNTLVLGGTVVFLDSPSFDAARTLTTIGREHIEKVIIAGNALAGPLADELDRAAAEGNPYDVSSVQIIMSSGMLWSDQAKSALLRHVDAQLFDIVGSSEGGPYAYSSVWSQADLPSKLRLSNGAVVLDEDGVELELDSGAVGLLAYRGPMPAGYYADPAKTAEVYRTIRGRRYVSPGDYVRLLGAGQIEFLGRGSAVVNTGGEKVFPAEVEEQLMTHDDVADCAVFGLADERWGQIVVAVVAAHLGRDLTDRQLTDHLSSRIAGYKKPRRILVVDSLERGPSGKLDLRALTARVEAFIADQQKEKIQ